jgi:hypothetical protein
MVACLEKAKLYKNEIILIILGIFLVILDYLFHIFAKLGF